MADQKQLAILRQGQEAWNTWRQQQPPDFQPDFSKANLRKADLIHTHLSRAHLIGADLVRADLAYVDLREADLSAAKIGLTTFGDLDLSTVKGLETVKHDGPSTIGIDTIYRSQGRIPERFLQQAGVPDALIDYMRSLVANPVIYYTCFLSYSSKDQDFVERLAP